MSDIHLHAEILPNIRQANLYASLNSPRNEHTRIEIGSDKKTVTVSHKEHSASVYLSTEINGLTQLDDPTGSDRELSARLALAHTVDLSSQSEISIGNGAPWSAKDLGPTARIRCRSCSVEVLLPNVRLQYKDLPSEHWAEMMELWHCHRPHDHTPQDTHETADCAANSKGYGSLTKLTASADTVYVDISTFLLAESSCTNIQVGSLQFLSTVWLLRSNMRPSLSCG
jgi:ubiquitin-protein ligase E3 D